MKGKLLLKLLIPVHLVLTLITIYISQVVAQPPNMGGDNLIEIAPDVYLLQGLSSNVLAVLSSEEILLVDNGSTGDAEKLSDLLQQAGATSVKYAINTHFHFDHVGGNESLGELGAIIVSQNNLKARMQTEWIFPDELGVRMPIILAYPEVALPEITYQDSMTLNFEGHDIFLLHFPTSHTDADTVVYLQNENIIHTGDLFGTADFIPPLDSYHGGTIDGWISTLDEIFDLINDNTQVVPGHGPVSNRQAIREFQQLLILARDSIENLVREGKSLEEVLEIDPLAEHTSKITSNFVRTVYAELAWLSSSMEMEE